MTDVAALNFGPREARCLGVLNAHGVEYLLVGGYAVRVHGYMRDTKDVDVLVGNDASNAQRVCDALTAICGVQHPNLTPDQVEVRKRQINLVDWGYDFEVLTAADGVTLSDALSRQVVLHKDELHVPVISKADLVTMKRHAGRPQDLEDVRALTNV